MRTRRRTPGARAPSEAGSRQARRGCAAQCLMKGATVLACFFCCLISFLFLRGVLRLLLGLLRGLVGHGPLRWSAGIMAPCHYRPKSPGAAPCPQRCRNVAPDSARTKRLRGGDVWPGVVPAQAQGAPFSSSRAAAAQCSFRACPRASQCNAQRPAARAVRLPAFAMAARQRDPVLRFIRNAAEIDAGVPRREVRGRDRQCLVQAAVPCVVDLDRAPRTLRKQRGEITPGGLRRGGPIRKREIARLDPMPGFELALASAHAR